MMMKHKARLSAMMLAAVVGCGDGDESPTPGQDDRPGFADSTLAPEGTPFNLPAGLELDEPITGFNPFDPDTCKRAEDKKAPEAQGSGDLIQVCLHFRNTTRQPLDLELPPGLIFLSESDKVQHGMLVQKLTIEVPSEQELFVPTKAYCLNDTRSGNGVTDLFKKGPVTQYSDFKELFTLLENKQLPVTGGAVVELQVAVWNLTHGKELTTADRDVIAALPNK